MNTFVSPPPAGWSDSTWVAYFLNRRLISIPWERGGDLSPHERALVAESVRAFQQGEGQEGGHFFRVVRQYAEASGNSDYVDAHRLFMAEERRHARDLARFLDLNGIPLLVEPFLFTWLFCWIGSRGGLEWTLRIIVMSEVIGQTYYRALFATTDSLVLRKLCSQILCDEKAHVRFQFQQLARLRRGRWGLAQCLTHWADRILLIGAGLVCWLGHRRVLRAGGYSWRRYWTQVMNNYSRCKCFIPGVLVAHQLGSISKVAGDQVRP